MKSIILLILFSLLTGATSYSQTDLNHRPVCYSHEQHLHQVKKDEQYAENQKLLEEKTKKFIQQRKSMRTTNGIITIPVVVHVLYNNDSENISEAQIQSQIDVLNKDFRRLNADTNLTPSLFKNLATDARIEFCLARRTPEGLSTNGITRTHTSIKVFNWDTAHVMKYTAKGGIDAWDSEKYLNIWVCNLDKSKVLGYAQLPGGPRATDGIVIGYNFFGTNGMHYQGYAKGRTTTHEVGHWLNLRHVWGDSKCGNDYVDDTPEQEKSNFYCPSFPHPSCNNSSDMFMNYMDYTFDECKNMFSKGQVDRMYAALILYRNKILTSDGCLPVEVLCNDTLTYRNQTATITDGSSSENYKNNSDCKWIIHPKGASTISIQFSELDLENEVDYLTIYDGPDTGSPVLASLTGTTLPAEIISTNNTVFIRFSTDDQNTGAGWKMTYTSNFTSNTPTCKDTVIFTSHQGHIEDGSGDLDYNQNLSCVYEIKPANAKAITLKFTEFKTEKYFDRLQLYVAGSPWVYWEHSGEDLPDSVYMDQGHIYLRFITDGAVNNQGWALDYTSDTTEYCKGEVYLTDSDGKITDGSGSKNYWHNTLCTYYINPDTDQPIKLHFTEFSLEENYDYVYVYDGLNMDSEPVASLTGKKIPDDVILTTGKGIIKFYTDQFTTATGWSLEYSQVVAGTESSVASGEVKFFPNPANDQITFSGYNIENMNYSIYNTMGEKIVNAIATSNSIDISNLPRGTYFIELQKNHLQLHYKFLKFQN